MISNPTVMNNGLLAWLGIIGDFEFAHHVFETHYNIMQMNMEGGWAREFVI